MCRLVWLQRNHVAAHRRIHVVLHEKNLQLSWVIVHQFTITSQLTCGLLFCCWFLFQTSSTNSSSYLQQTKPTNAVTCKFPELNEKQFQLVSKTETLCVFSLRWFCKSHIVKWAETTVRIQRTCVYCKLCQNQAANVFVIFVPTTETVDVVFNLFLQTKKLICFWWQWRDFKPRLLFILIIILMMFLLDSHLCGLYHPCILS